MFWFQWTVLPLGKHKPPRAVVIANVTATDMVQIRQWTDIAIEVVDTTSHPEATGFLVLRQDLVDVGKVAPTTHLSVASGFNAMLGIAGIPVVAQLLGIVTDGIPCPLQGLSGIHQLLDEYRQESNVLGLGAQPALSLGAVLLGILIPPVVGVTHDRLRASLIADSPIIVEGRIKGRTVEVLHASLDDLLNFLLEYLFGRSLGVVLQEVIVEAQLGRPNQLEDILLVVAGSVLSGCRCKLEHTTAIRILLHGEASSLRNLDLQFVVFHCSNLPQIIIFS